MSYQCISHSHSHAFSFSACCVDVVDSACSTNMHVCSAFGHYSFRSHLERFRRQLSRSPWFCVSLCLCAPVLSWKLPLCQGDDQPTSEESSTDLDRVLGFIQPPKHALDPNKLTKQSEQLIPPLSPNEDHRGQPFNTIPTQVADLCHHRHVADADATTTCLPMQVCVVLFWSVFMNECKLHSLLLPPFFLWLGEVIVMFLMLLACER